MLTKALDHPGPLSDHSPEEVANVKPAGAEVIALAPENSVVPGFAIRVKGVILDSQGAD